MTSAHVEASADISPDPCIASLDLDPIAYRLALDEGWELEEVDAAMAEYRVFLHAARHEKEHDIAPTKIMDKVWHQHILDTGKYCQDCDRLFGKYLHHFPYSGLIGEADLQLQQERYARSLELYSRIRPAYQTENRHVY